MNKMSSNFIDLKYLKIAGKIMAYFRTYSRALIQFGESMYQTILFKSLKSGNFAVLLGSLILSFREQTGSLPLTIM